MRRGIPSLGGASGSPHASDRQFHPTVTFRLNAVENSIRAGSALASGNDPADASCCRGGIDSILRIDCTVVGTDRTQVKRTANQTAFRVGDTVDCAVGHERYDELLNDMGIPSTTVFTEVLDGEHLAVNVDGTWLTGNIVAFGPRGNVAIKLTAVEPEDTATH